MVVVRPLVVHPYHPFRDTVRLLRQPAVFIVAVDIVRIFRDAVNPFSGGLFSQFGLSDTLY
ncbi:TPA: type IV secretion protein Rhs [Escherichia coli]|nr:type IV secretion protein Rhs [Escherichia coli]HBA8766043.1 type IV secretion protein Rhs [Escherichia coli]